MCGRGQPRGRRPVQRGVRHPPLRGPRHSTPNFAHRMFLCLSVSAMTHVAPFAPWLGSSCADTRADAGGRDGLRGAVHRGVSGRGRWATRRRDGRARRAGALLPMDLPGGIRRREARLLRRTRRVLLRVGTAQRLLRVRAWTCPPISLGSGRSNTPRQSVRACSREFRRSVCSRERKLASRQRYVPWRSPQGSTAHPPSTTSLGHYGCFVAGRKRASPRSSLSCDTVTTYWRSC
jgi:hypothetical protein